MPGPITPATAALRAHGVQLTRLAEEAGIGKRTTSGYMGGHWPMSRNVAAAVRRLLPKDAAEEVIRLATDAWEARRG